MSGVRFMSRLLKYIIIIVILIAIVIWGGLYYYKNYMYSLEKVSAMLNSVKFPSNIYMEYENYYGDSSEPTTVVNTYIKDNKQYIIQEDKQKTENYLGKIESLFDYDNKEEIVIYHGEKTISSHEYEEILPQSMPLKSNFFLYVELHGRYEHRGKYEFHGKEMVNDKKCIKVSFTDEYDDYTSRYYFYIDLETNFIVKQEAYYGDTKETLEKTVTEIYEIYPNTVTDEQILKFDINNYPDYKFFGT